VVWGRLNLSGGRDGLRTNSSGFGVQSLKHVTARASSARVLDLHSLAKECVDDAEHRDRPLFSHPVLNRTIIVKHHPRSGEIESEIGGDRAVVTKIIFPFDPEDLDLGGQFLLTGDAELADKLKRFLDYREEGDLERDMALLGVIDRLPTLDPFLLREALALQRVDVAPCYFRLSATDRSEMRDFVAHQVETLIGLCFSTVSEAQAKKLSDLILSGGDDPELDPLREALRMTPDAFAEAMFCWKAVLYYRWRTRGLGPELKATLKSITGVQLSRFDPHSARFVRTALERLTSHIRECERRIAERFRHYDQVFEALTAQRTPEPFQRFLTQGPVVFADTGGSMGRLEQIVSYWAYQFPGGRTRDLSPDAIFDGLRNLLVALSIGAPVDGTEKQGEPKPPQGDEAAPDGAPADDSPGDRAS
jgi:hypothetical protein